MTKGDKFYYDNFSQTAELSQKAAVCLVECLKNYDANRITSMLDEMHKIEHSADKKKHEMNEALVKAFVTPVDREDLDLLSNELDDVVDVLEEILQKFYIYDIRSIRPDAIEFAEKLVVACGLIRQAMAEFGNFKKSKRIRELIIELNSVEEDCDRQYLTAMRALTKDTADILEVVSWRTIYDCLEECADACEHVSECIGSVIMKNT